MAQTGLVRRTVWTTTRVAVSRRKTRFRGWGANGFGLIGLQGAGDVGRDGQWDVFPGPRKINFEINYLFHYVRQQVSRVFGQKLRLILLIFFFVCLFEISVGTLLLLKQVFWIGNFFFTSSRASKTWCCPHAKAVKHDRMRNCF